VGNKIGDFSHNALFVNLVKMWHFGPSTENDVTTTMQASWQTAI